MSIVVIVFFALYFVLTIALTVGWRRAVAYKPSAQNTHTPVVTVVVAARNEAEHIASLLNDLAQQTYTHFEVIVVDDHSDDNTGAIADTFSKRFVNIRLITSTGTGKKAALTQAIREAKGEIIIATDADCRMSKQWISTMVTYFTEVKVQMIFGGVVLSGNSYFASLQALEFVSLIGSGAATMAFGIPTMCNGANLAFRKNAFEAVGGYEGNQHIPSGDDEFLLRKIVHHYPGSVVYAGAPEAVVHTSTSPTLRAFIHQRIRWAGKWRHHQSFVSKLLAVFIAAFQAMVFVLPALVVMQRIDAGVALGLWVTKAVLEFGFLKTVCHNLRPSWRWRAFLSLQLLYPLYILGIGVFSNFRTFEWKGRKLKSLTVSHN